MCFIKELKMDYKQGAFLCALLQVLLCQPVLMQWSFSVPREITALEGSCVVIPCAFTGSIGTSDRPLAFTWCLWRSSTYPMVYNNKDPTDVLPHYEGRALLVGDLLDHNCTLQINSVTGRDADEYYPLIERKYSYSVSVTVSGTPARPRVTLPRTMTEGVPVTITCSGEHTCPAHPPTLAWDKIHSNVSIYHEELLDGIWRTVLVLNYTPAAEHHMEEFVCTANYPGDKSASQSITLNIRYAPRNTTAAEHYHRKTIKEGDTVTLSCSSRGNPEAKTYRWFEGPQKTPTLGYWSVLTLKNIRWDSGPYVCTATNGVGTGESPPLHLNIQHVPKGVDVFLVEDPQEGKPMELSCATNGSSPRETHFTWYKNEKVIQEQEGNTLKIESTAMDDAGDYRCVAHNAMGSTSSALVTVNVKRASESSTFAVLGGVAAAIFLILLLLVIFIIIRGRKKKVTMAVKEKLPTTATGYNRHVENHEELPMKEHVYGNIDNYIHVRGQDQRRPMQEYPELTNPNGSNIEEGYSQLPGRKQEEQVSEELNYATIHHFQRPETSPNDSHGEEMVEYATVRC